MDITAPMSFLNSPANSIKEIARDQIVRWSELCQKCIDFQPTPEQVPDYINTVKWVLRFTRTLHSTASDPEYPDRQIAYELEGRLIQLEHVWRRFNNPLSPEEADQLAAEIFA